MNHLSDEELALYVDGLKLRRTEDLPRELLEHVEGCLQCKKAILELSALVPASLHEYGEPHPFFGSREKSKKSGWEPGMPFRVAAALVLLLAGGTAIFLLSPRWWTSIDKSSQVAAHKTDSAAGRSQHKEVSNAAGKPLAQNDSPSDAFLPSPLFEGLAGQAVRSGGIEVLGPRLGDTITEHQLFHWIGQGADDRWKIEILTNHGNERLSADVKGGSYTLGKQLAPGLYYWKLEEEGELLYVGKVLVLSSPAEEHKTALHRGE